MRRGRSENMQKKSKADRTFLISVRDMMHKYIKIVIIPFVVTTSWFLACPTRGGRYFRADM